MRGVAGASVPAGPGTPGYDDGMDAPADGDLFGAFNSVTLHYDGES